MFKSNQAPADFIADALSGIITTAVKHFVVDRGIEYARAKVDTLLAPPEMDDVIDGEVEEEVEVEETPTEKKVEKKTSSKK